MVDYNWIERKIILLERDRLDQNWSDVREKQLKFLFALHRTGDFALYTCDQINERLVSIFHGQDC